MGAQSFYTFNESFLQKKDSNESLQKGLEVLIVVLSFLKIFELLRVTEQFGKNINLFFKSLYDMRWYMLFFIAWILQFSILYEILGIKIHGWKLIYNSWEIGIGGGNTPTLVNTEPFLLVLLNIIWVLNQFFLVVVMLNFLIALLSQSYEESMNNMIIDRYRTRADMNAQVYMVLNILEFIKVWLGYKKKEIDIIIVSKEVENDNINNQNEWNGFAKTVKNFNKK